MSTDPRIEGIERGIERVLVHVDNTGWADSALSDLHAWQEVWERHESGALGCRICMVPAPCPDRQAADAALHRLYRLWGTDV